MLRWVDFIISTYTKRTSHVPCKTMTKAIALKGRKFLWRIHQFPCLEEGHKSSHLELLNFAHAVHIRFIIVSVSDMSMVVIVEIVYPVQFILARKLSRRAGNGHLLIRLPLRRTSNRRHVCAFSTTTTVGKREMKSQQRKGMSTENGKMGMERD